LRTFTFKVIPDQKGSSNNKVSSNPQPEGKPGTPPEGICPPPPDYAPIAPPPPMGECPSFQPLPPYEQSPFFQPIPPYEEMLPFGPVLPLQPDCPFEGQYPFPEPPQAVPVLPGHTIRPCLAHAYVPWQFYTGEYPPNEALNRGTLFPELYQPQGEYGPCEGPKPCMMVFPRGGVPDEEQ
jgi:hypothetical protein